MLERAHVVQAVGELDEENPYVVGNGEQQLAQVFRLLGLLGDEVELLDLGEAFDQTADIFAEQLVDLGAGGRGILDRVMQQGDRDRRFVETHVSEDGGNFKRMGDIGITAGARLLAVLLHGIDIGLVEQSFVGIGLVFLHPLHELVLPHHSDRLHKRKSAPVETTGAHSSYSQIKT